MLDGLCVNTVFFRASYAFPSADVLIPAPMAVSILGQRKSLVPDGGQCLTFPLGTGQLTLVATTTDFKLVQPTNGFKHVRYPDSFRATIMQLVNTGALSLNQSFVNFDEINKRCAAVRPGVNNIVQLLVGDEDNTPRQNELAVERHLPNQIAALSKTIQACLEKAKETDTVFNQLLELTMEIHESCAATQGTHLHEPLLARLDWNVPKVRTRGVSERRTSVRCSSQRRKKLRKR